MQPQALTVSIDDLYPNDFNPNVVSPENERKLAEAIKRLGFFKPIVVRETNEGFEILGGEHRWQAARHLEMREVPVMNLGPIDDSRAREVALADNARYGADDALSLADLLEDLGDTNDIKSFLPFSDNDFESIFSSTNIALDELEVDENFEAESAPSEKPEKKPERTHTILRFKVSIEDAERIDALLDEIKDKHGLHDADDLTNAGDALVALLLAGDDE